MPSLVHVVVTAHFAGVERYVSDVARETADRGWDVAVVGGHPTRMREAVGESVRWLPGATPLSALRSLRRLGRRDLCHSHMTVADAVAVGTRPIHRAPVVSTRHFAAPRGASRAGRLLAPWIARGVTREIAVSEFVASRMERRPDAVIPNGVSPSPCLWRSTNRTVLVLQRLEREKDTLTALRAWQESGLADEGWTLRVVGDGSARASLEAWTASEGVPRVTFAGWAMSVEDELAKAGVLLAPAATDSFGLAIVEAMAAGVPVAAAAAGGHLETVARLREPALFESRDHLAAASVLRSLLDDDVRARLSQAGRQLVEAELTTTRHVDRILLVYADACSSRTGVAGLRTSEV